MKKQLLLSIVFLIGTLSQAQNVPTNEIKSLDRRLSNIDQSTVSSGIIYERVTPYANLYNFNKSKDFNTATKQYMVQAMSELYRASNQTKFVSATALKERTYQTLAKNQVDIAILNADFDVLNYNEKEPNKGGLLFDADTQRFSQIKGKPTFFPFHTTVVAAMKNKVVGNSITFNIKNDLFFNNSNDKKQIKTLNAEFGTGVQHTLINDYKLKKQQITIAYRPSDEGDLTITFNITYKDNSAVTTKAKLKLKYLSGQHKKVARGNIDCDPDGLKEDQFIISDYPFKGYEESFAFKGRSDYRIFYDKVNNNTVLNKPIIIIDGFDPQDKRKILRCDYDFYKEDVDRAIEDVMVYYAKDLITNDLVEYVLIEELRLKGYDVIIVNNTNYCVQQSSPHAIRTDLYDEENNRCTQPGWNLIDGGADYIERNGLNLVSLIQHVNNTLTTNGSTEQLVIVGPSMGGQISRYALAYMEKNNIPHNTRLWVSVDSPHLGANIPMGTQALLNLLKDGNEKAGDFYDNQLGSIAARQQLIEFHQQSPGNYHLVDQDNLNGRVASQGFPSDDGSLFYRTYYNNLQNNGLPSSDGYPQNLRKIALVNGSLTGSGALKNNANGTIFSSYDGDSEQTVNVRGFNKVCFIGCWDVHTASMESYTLPHTGADQKIARFKKGLNDRTTRSPNINSRGNMDIVPGGFFNSYDEIHSSIMGQSGGLDFSLSTMGMNLGLYAYDWGIGLFFDENSTRLESRKNSKVGSFIPTFSAIAHKNPNQNWNNPLNYNLVCANETHFDSYYGEVENTQHTSFNEKSVSWLFKELANDPQPPTVYLKDSDIVGSSSLCAGEIKTYTIDACKISGTVNWQVSSGLQIISSTNTSVTVKPNSNYSSAYIKAVTPYTTITKNIALRVIFPLDIRLRDPNTNAPIYVLCDSQPNYVQVKHDNNDDIDDWQWSVIGAIITYHSNASNDNSIVSIRPTTSNPIIKVKAHNACGWSDWVNLGVGVMPCGYRAFSVYPNPVSDVLTIERVNMDEKDTISISSKEIYAYEIYNMSQKLIAKGNLDSLTEINVSSFKHGVYILKIIKGKATETHHIILD